MFTTNKNYALLIILLAFTCSSFAQKTSNNWYFGKKVGLSFNQDPPRVLYNSQLNSVEGCASISDNNGNLLFYTNGSVVMNKNHQIMKNGQGLLGNVSSTSNTVIVPMPDSNGIYLLFTIGAAGIDEQSFNYNKIDINRDNGLGEIVNKNVRIESDVYEKLAAVRHCNSKDVWIVIRKWDSDEYHTYLLTAAGLSASPIISNSGLVVGGYFNNSLGALKFSPDATKLVAIHSFENNAIELMNFNNATGVLSNPLSFKPNNIAADGSYMGVYGAEFSPDAQLLYVSANYNTTVASALYQFDVSAMDVTSIAASKQVIAETGPWRGGSLQAAPDQKIYFSMYNDSSLSVIENPNIQGPGCNFKYHHIYFSNEGGSLQYGLPVFIAGDMNSTFTPYDFFTTYDCSSLDVRFLLNKTAGVDSVHWDFGDGFESTLFAPTHPYGTAGSYEVALTLFKNDCTSTRQIIKHTVLLEPFSGNTILPGDVNLCQVKDFVISTNYIAETYVWNTGATDTSITVSLPGTYWLEIRKNGCVIRDSIIIGTAEPIRVNLGKDTVVCANNPIELVATTPGNYLWNTGATTRTIEVKEAGIYKVMVSYNGCTTTDTVIVNWGDCGIFLPSAFTPNGDSYNDGFSLVNGINTQSFMMTIYNRYGETVFSSWDPLKKWFGKFKGKDMPMGVYPWLIVYKKDNRTHTLKGTVLLIR